MDSRRTDDGAVRPITLKNGKVLKDNDRVGIVVEILRNKTRQFCLGMYGFHEKYRGTDPVISIIPEFETLIRDIRKFFPTMEEAIIWAKLNGCEIVFRHPDLLTLYDSLPVCYAVDDVFLNGGVFEEVS